MDWDKDGHLDILSGCYCTDGEGAGHIQVLSGEGNLNFGAAGPVLNAAGRPLLSPKLAEATDSDLAEDQEVLICTHQHVMDYDGDGDLDMVVGCSGTKFFFYENAEVDGQAKLSDSPIELSIQSPDDHSAPHLTDWDGDGDLDLLTGAISGGVHISVNTGSREEPEWSEFKQLIAGPKFGISATTSFANATPSAWTRIWVCDWNRDGLPDILLGDRAQIGQPRKGLSLDEYRQRLVEHQKEYAPVNDVYQKLMEEYRNAIQAGDEVNEELMEKLMDTSKKLNAMNRERSEFEDSRSTGFVWLYLQKPRSDATAGTVNGQD